MPIILPNNSSKIISYMVFGFTILIAIISFTSLIFPSFLGTLFLGTKSDQSPFELGIWAVPFFSINIFFLIFGWLYYKKNLPKKIIKSFDFILKFEVSRNTTIIVFSIFVGIYIIFTIGEIFQNEIDVWKDWEKLGPIIENFPSLDEGPRGLKILIMNNFLLFSSQEIFHNVKVLPLIGSISLIFLTYFLTFQITKKRFAGLVAMAILLQSHTFLRYDTTATYSNFWTSFYLVSLYLIFKKWTFSPLAYLASIFSKALTIVFLPMSLFVILRSYLPKTKKIILIVLYSIIIFIILFSIILTDKIGYGNALTSFEFADFVVGFTAWSFQLRIDGLVLMFLLPLTIGLFLKSLSGVKEADSILVLIYGILLSGPLLVAFSEFNIQPYRWIPLIVFFAIGVGVLLSKTSTYRPVK